MEAGESPLAQVWHMLLESFIKSTMQEQVSYTQQGRLI